MKTRMFSIFMFFHTAPQGAVQVLKKTEKGHLEGAWVGLGVALGGLGGSWGSLGETLARPWAPLGEHLGSLGPPRASFGILKAPFWTFILAQIIDEVFSF